MEYAIEGYSSLVVSKYKTEKKVLYLPQAFLSNIHYETDSRYSTGGKQGLNLMAFQHGGDTEFIINVPTFSIKFLEMAAGSQIHNNTKDVQQMQNLQVNQGIITLDYVPKDENIDNIKVYQLNKSGQYVIEEVVVNNITGNEVEVVANDYVLAIYLTTADVHELAVGKVVNQGYYIIQGQTEIHDAITSTTDYLYFTLPKVAFSPGLDLRMLNSRVPEQMFRLYCKALADDKGNLIYLYKRR